MKITAVRLLHLRGTMRTEGKFWEDRLVRPIDIYPEYRIRNDFEGGTQADAHGFRLEQYFLRIETDEGPIGMSAWRRIPRHRRASTSSSKPMKKSSTSRYPPLFCKMLLRLGLE